jgi:mannose-1-phosphate guanylyltransferase
LQILPVILSGGAGTRLWPLSTQHQPKQFSSLVGTRTMLQMTAERTLNSAFAGPFVVGNRGHADLIEAQLGEVAASPSLLILEPFGRNTAAAIALAALHAPDELLLIMPSDHVIEDATAFMDAVISASPTAQNGWLVTFGVRPTRAETGFGYIRKGERLIGPAYKVDRFVEKPVADVAKVLASDGHHFWNGGIFLFRGRTYLKALSEHAPELHRAVLRAFEQGQQSGIRFSPDAEAFAAIPSISVDYAVMEKATNVAVVPLDVDWSDVGSWEALHELLDNDERGNASIGETTLIDCRGSLVRSDGPMVVAIGVDDLVIVATKEAILVVPKADSQRVKEATELLSKQN